MNKEEAQTLEQDLLDLALRFQALNLNGSDLSVEFHRESPVDRAVTAVSITGRIVYPITKVEDAEFQFVIVIDRIGRNEGRFGRGYWTPVISSNVQATIIDHKKGKTIPAKMTLLGGVEAFQEAEAIANTLEALLTPEPPAEPAVVIEISFIKAHDIMGCFHQAGCDLPKKWDNFFTDGISAFDCEDLDNNEADGIVYRMSVRDAKALRNRAHRAARTWIKEYGDDWQNHILEELRDHLDRALEALAA